MEDAQNAKIVMEKLNQKLTTLIDLVSGLQPPTIGFNIESITKEQETNILKNGIKELKVEILNQWHHHYSVYTAWRAFYKDFKYSTKFVDRLPGLVVINENKHEIKTLVNDINTLKDELATIVRNGRNTQQKHGFIYTMTSSHRLRSTIN